MGVLVAPVCKLWNLLLFCLASSQTTPRRLTHEYHCVYSQLDRVLQVGAIISESAWHIRRRILQCYRGLNRDEHSLLITIS